MSSLMETAMQNYLEKEDKELKPKEVEVLGLHMAGLTRPQIAKELSVTLITVDRWLQAAQKQVALRNPDSLVARGRKAVNKLIPKSIRTYDKALNDYPNRPGLALRAAGEVLKGTQVLIPKEERETVKETVETKRVLMLERLEIACQFGVKTPDSGQIGVEQGQVGASDTRPAGVERLKSSPERPDPTPGEADQGGGDPSEIGASECEG